MSEASCRADVWLWRARFFKTRALAAAFLEAGRIRHGRRALERRLDKPSAALMIDDELVFVLSERVIHLRIAALGERRGPASEARTLYALVTQDQPPKA